MKKLIINTDGGARGNPGPAGIGVLFSDENGEIVAKFKEYIGEATNNVAEYRALILALDKAKNLECQEIECRLDSELIVKQLKGEYKVKDEKMKDLYAKVQELIFFKPVNFIHVRREKNKEADTLVNEAIDENKNS
ncbi:ribonuclease HI family protein [Patescibacteria group bacterium]|nr:ribonuclease HI family protein [Patescibacteria group bacterium]